MIVRKDIIYGAMFGDLVGSRFVLNPIKSKNFQLINKDSHFTDDTVMIIAVEKAVLKAKNDFKLLRKLAIDEMRKAYLRYPNMDYGLMFKDWLMKKIDYPYKSYGNGGAMRVIACGIYYETLEESLACAKVVTNVTHSSEEGLKAALATTEAIFLARNNYNKEKIKKAMNKYYNLDFKLDDIRKEFYFNSDASYTMPAALNAFFESKDYIDAIRNAISLGGDSDTIATITGAIAASYYKSDKKVIQIIKEKSSFF